MNGLRYKRVQRTPYSLVELITVLIIVTILMGLGIGAYLGVRGHKSSEAGAQRMADMIALARQYAISENTRVALLLPLFPGEPSNIYDAKVDYRNKLPKIIKSGDAPGIIMHLCEVDSQGNFVSWLESGDWTSMPQNAYFSYITLAFEKISNIQYPTDTDRRDSRAIIFQPNGTLTQKMSGYIYVEPYSTSDKAYDPGKARQYRIQVNWLTGMAKTEMMPQGGW